MKSINVGYKEKNTKRQVRKQTLFAIVLLIAMIASSTVGFSLALFANSTSANATFTFGRLQTEISINGGTTYTTQNEAIIPLGEFSQGETVVQAQGIKVRTVENGMPAYMRVRVFYRATEQTAIDTAVALNSALSITANSWSANDINNPAPLRYYYLASGEPLALNACEPNTPITFNNTAIVLPDLASFNLSNYSTNSLQLVIEAQSVQEEHLGVATIAELEQLISENNVFATPQVQGYFVRFDTMGGPSVTNQVVSSNGTSTVTMPTVGGVSVNWFTTNALTGTSIASGSASNAITTNTTFYAKYPTSNTQIYVFFEKGNENGIDGTLPTNGVATLNSSNYEINAPKSLTRDGYTHNGWKIKGENTPLSMSSNTVQIPQAQVTVGHAVTLVPAWSANEYTAIFNANGGTVSPNSDTYNIEGSLLFPTPEKAGEIFMGWKVDSTVNRWRANDVYTSGAFNTAGYYDNVTFTALWSSTSENVTLDKQGGIGGTSQIVATSGSTLPSNIELPTKQGYIFGGYYTEPNGAGTQFYLAGGSPTETAWSESYNTILYANWTANTYTITFDKQGGTGGTASVNAEYGSAMPSADAPTKVGYTFAGYYDATSGGTQYYTSGMASARNWDKPSNTTLYAHWTVTTYTISYNLDGGTASNPTSYTIETPTFTLNNPTKEGFVFTGWTGTGLPSASTSVTINQGSTGNKTFTANWLSAVARVGSTYFATLSDAISAVSANSSATIELIGNTSESGLTIGNDKNITLVASGANRTITRNADATLFVIDNGATLTLGASTSSANYLILDGNYYNKRVVNNQGILTLNVGIIQGGSNRESAEWASYVASGYGGGVLNGKTFNMNGGTIQNCKAAGAGGGVYSAVGSNMQMSGNATITNNTATGNGGGVCACSTFNMNGGTISNNTAVNGGGLRITIDGAVTMSGGTITGNETTGSGGGVDSVGLFIMNGGVISSNIAITNGAGVYILNGTFTFSGGTIKGNEATVDGGGVYQDGGTFTMDNANSVIGDLEEPNLAGRNGGAVYQLKGTFNFSAGTIGNSSGATVTNGTVMDTNAGSFANKASHLQNGSGGGIYQGGGTLNLSGNAIVARNYSAYRTGGIYSQSTMTINGAGVHISYNIATNLAGGLKTNTNSLFTFTAGNIHNNKASHGGGICVAWDCVTPDKKLINGENAKIYNNVATSGGGGIYFEAWTGGSSATAVAGAGKLTMTAGEIKDNIATVGGGGISMMSSSNATTNTHATSEFKMSGGKISGNSAKDGGAIYGSGATIILSGTVVIELNEATNATTGGGAIYLANGSVNLPASLTMSAVEIKNNISASNGGGVYLASGTFNMYGGTISSNSAVDGGGVYQASGTFNMNGGVIGDDTATTCATSNEGEHSNYASGNGGGICSVGGDLNIIGGTIAYNYAVQNGGGIIYTDNSAKDFVLDGVNINYNFANSTNGGGGVYVNGLHSFTVTGTTMIKGNGATNRGGGIRSCIAFTMTGGTVQGNFLVQSGLGGGMYISSGTINATGSNNVLITENSIPLGGGGGGAIYTGSYITIGKCTISSNTSQGSAGVHVNAGGGIMNSDSAIIKENNATGNGGGLFVKAGTFTIDAGTIYGADGGENANTGNGSALYNQSGTVQIKKINGSYHTVASGGVINTTIHAPLGMVTYDMNGGNLPTGVHTNTAYQSVSNVVVTGGLLSTGTVNAGQMMFENEVIFDGTDDYISLGNNYKYTNALTVSLWAYMDNWADIWTSSSNYMILFSSAESGGYSINPQSSTGKILMQVRIGGSYKAVVANKTFASLASGWHNFAFTFDGASTNLVGYVDGVSIGQTVAGSEISYHATNSVLVGAEAKTGDTPKAGYYFNGKVKGVNILNQALDATQINSLMNSITQNVTNRSALSGANMPTPTRDGYEFAGWGLLPDEYQLVEYLQSTGTQYINTGFPAGDDVGINIDYARIGNVDTIVMGSNGTGESRLVIGLYTGNSVRFGWNTYSATIPINADVKMNMKLNYLNNRQELFNDELFAQINTTLGVSNTFNISMFAGNLNGTTKFGASTKIYGAQITKGNLIVRNFMPCVRKADNKPGMFDTVTNTFYVNNGTGEFAVGRNLNLVDEANIISTSNSLKLYAQWEVKITYVSNHSQLQAAIENGGVIAITNNITATTGYSINGTVTLISSGGNWSITRNAGSSLFFINSGATLTLGASATDTNVINIIGNDKAETVIDNYAGTLNLNSANIYGGTSPTAAVTVGPTFGGGVYVYSGGTFNMYGGSIQNCKATGEGGGVFVRGSSSVFNMNGGTISGNTASEGGGVFVYNNGTFNMNGGTISGNTAETEGGGVYVDVNGTFNMNGGTISSNTAQSDGGGVYVDGTFNMTGGVIYGTDGGAGYANTATTGAALSDNSGTATNDGVAISTTNNTITS